MATRNGTPGNDTLTGTASADSLFGLGGNDSLLGLGGNDRLEGGGGNDTLDGGIGIDTMLGQAGNDTYIIDNTVDTVTESASSGIDTVLSSVSYVLGSSLDNLTLTRTGAINGTGNDLNNTITGNAANNNLTGGGGNDTLYGGRGNDTLYGGGNENSEDNDILFGGDGNDILYTDSGYSFSLYSDILHGGNGNDTLYGRYDSNTLYGDSGDDTYILDISPNNQYGIGNNIIIEASNSGTDTVQSVLSYTLGDNLESLTLIGSGSIDGIGNSLNNRIIGNTNNNTIVAGFGFVGEKDTLTGGAGRDIFILGSAAQVFYDDRLKASAGTGDYALITDFNKSADFIKLNGRRTDYFISISPTGLPLGEAIYRNKPTGEKDELIALVQRSSNLNLNGNYFKFTADEINLSQLNGSNGFKINGIDVDDFSGRPVSKAGDVNGDGFDDIIIGAFPADPNGQNYSGSSYVVFGKQGGFDSSLNLSTLNGINGFVINGINVGDFSGKSVSSAGDFNGDGFKDIIIGAPGAMPNDQNEAGSSYVVFGKEGGFDSSFNLSTLNGVNGFVINGINAGDDSGQSVSSTGDINGDGFDDIIVGAIGIGANLNGQNYSGSSYVVFGKEGGFDSSFNLSTLNGVNGFVINGIDAGDLSGFSVSSAGDVNSDGFDDIIIGAFLADPNGQDTAGESYVVFGKQGGFDSSLNLFDINGINGFVVNGINEADFSGSSVKAAGDVNSDGFDDIIIGAFRANPNGQDGAGESYVVFGKQGGFDSSLNLSTLNGINGFKINGSDADDLSGSSVSTAGDVNGDGFDDLIIGANGADPNSQNNAGESYLVFGKEGGFGASFNFLDINGSNGLVINGIDARDFSGGSVSSAGDVNGDGFDDLIIGANGADPNGQNYAGESYVIFGRDFTGSITRTGTTGNDTLTGTAGDDILVGGLGNDRLIGGKGVDVLIGGAGNDIITFGIIDRRSNGGSGIDTLRIDGRDSIDLTTIANNKLTSFEIIDITGTGNNSLVFTRLDVLDLSDTTNQLIVNGNAGDKVTSSQQGWAFGGTTTVDSVLYQQYMAGAAILLVDADITQTLIS